MGERFIISQRMPLVEGNMMISQLMPLIEGNVIISQRLPLKGGRGGYLVTTCPQKGPGWLISHHMLSNDLRLKFNIFCQSQGSFQEPPLQLVLLFQVDLIALWYCS